MHDVGAGMTEPVFAQHDVKLPLVLCLAGEPVGKGRPKFSTRGGFARAITPEKTRRYEDLLRAQAQVETRLAIPVTGPLEVEVIARFPIPPSWSKKRQEMARQGTLRPTKKPDADNLLKCLDALNQVVWVDDSQIVSAKITKVYAEVPCLIVTIRSA